jgi:phospholipid N-methyltransferase
MSTLKTTSPEQMGDRKVQGRRAPSSVVEGKSPNGRGDSDAHWEFLREFMKNPARTAAVAPSSRKLGERMMQGIDFAKASSIVEFGPGSGSITRVIVERIEREWRGTLVGAGAGARVPSTAKPFAPGVGSASGDKKFLAIEFNPRMAEIVRERFPAVTVVNDSAENVETICEQHGIAPGSLDMVLSGLGWVSFPPALCTKILEATHRVLKPGGEFRTFGYHVGLMMPGSHHFRAEIARLFPHVWRTRGVWANLPPAFVYVCRK